MLTETAIRSAKPRERPYKLFDERGLYLRGSDWRPPVALPISAWRKGKAARTRTTLTGCAHVVPIKRAA
jgi:hypothetical protein